jgi:hypothetical protein
MEFDIYWKPTDATFCIPSDSHHFMVHKLAAFESGLFRMYISDTNLSEKKERVSK